MGVFLAQIILARRNDEVEGWMNLLFVIVVAVFWVLGGILKAKSKKPQGKEQAGPLRRPVRRPQQAHGMQPQRRAVEKSRPRPATAAQRPQHAPASEAPAGETVFSHPLFRNLAAQIERATGMKIPTEMPKPQAPKKPQTDKPVPAVEAVRPPQTLKPLAVEEIPTALLLDTSNPDDLRRAILYSEILGKPVSLRNPSEFVIGL